MKKRFLAGALAFVVMLSFVGCSMPLDPLPDNTDITVEWNANGGSGTVASYVGKKDSFTTASIPNGNTLTYEGHTFMGWSVNTTSSAMNNDDIVTLVKGSTRKFYAVWQEDLVKASYTVTFNSAGGSSVEPIVAEEGTTISSPAVPSNGTHIFAGWFKELALENEWNFATDKVVADTILYAKWAEVTGIEVTTLPTKISYKHGEMFDVTGMEVDATYSNQTTALVTSYTFSPNTSLTSADTEVTILYAGKTATVSITVEKEVKSIQVVTMPTKTTYSYNEAFDPSGMVVSATYTDNSTAIITDYTYTPSGGLSMPSTTITVYYAGSQATFTVEVEVVILSIEVETMPTKTVYEAGEVFDPSGLTIRVNKNDSSHIISSDVTFTSSPLIPTNTAVTVMHGGKSTNVNITVNRNDFSVKRGGAYNFNTISGTTVADLDLLWGGGVNGIAWHYNWGNSPSTSTVETASNERGLDFFPMTWRDYNANTIRQYVARNPECEWLLAFNEPNLTDQANLTPAQAATRWPAVVALAKELGLKIVSPAMNNGTLSGYSDPITWLDEFFGLNGYPGFEGVSLDDIDAISIHCYMDYPSAVKSYIEKFYKYEKEIWMTEICAWENQNNNLTNNQWRWQARHMSDILTFMELDPHVARYSWFIPKGDNLGENDHPYNKLLTRDSIPQLTELGKVYVNLSVLDNTVYSAVGAVIDASQYTNCNVSEWVGSNWQAKSGWRNTINSRPSDDVEGFGVLEIHNFTKNSNVTAGTERKWVEYQIEVTEAGSYSLTLRNNAVNTTKFDVSVGGNSKGTATLNAGGGWTNTTFSLGALPVGKHVIRLTCTDGGDASINWLQVNKI